MGAGTLLLYGLFERWGSEVSVIPLAFLQERVDIIITRLPNELKISAWVISYYIQDIHPSYAKRLDISRC